MAVFLSASARTRFLLRWSVLALVLCAGADRALAANVAIVKGDFYTTNLKTQLIAKGHTVTEVMSYTAASLAPYDAVLHYGNSFVDFTELESYVQGGGIVIETPWFWNNFGPPPNLLLLPNYSGNNFSTSFPGVTVLDAGNPLLSGVSFPAPGSGSIGRTTGNTFAAGTTAVAQWQDGTAMIATRALGSGVVIAINLHVVTSDTAYQAIDQPWASQLFSNAVQFNVETCGNGTVGVGEQCDDGNASGGDCCSATCQYEAASSPCTDDALACTTDLCDGSGVCIHSAGNSGAVCRGSAGACDLVETCDGLNTDCPADAKSTASCRGLAGECDAEEVCDGVSDECPVDAKRSAGEACSSDANVCSDDVCDGSGDDCTHPANSNPCDDDIFCNGEDTCSGGSCVVHDGDPCSAGSECNDSCNEVADNCAESAGTACSSDGNVCTDDVCDGSGACGVNNTASCNDGIFCNGTDTCGGGSCNHSGDPCPGTDCNHCQEGSDSCFDTALSACTDDESVCTFDRCDGAGLCTHPAIPLAEVCNFAIVGGSDTVAARVRTRLGVVLDGGVCANKGDIGLSSVMLDDASWVLTNATGTAAKVRGLGELDLGDVVSGGGCFKGAKHAEIYDTGLNSICCAESPADVPDPAGVVNACPTSPRLADCVTAKSQVSNDIATLNALVATQTLAAMNCTPGEPCSVSGSLAMNVIDIERVDIRNDGSLTIDALGNSDAVFVLRLGTGIRSKLRGAVVLAGGAQAKNVAIFARAGNCDFGDQNTGEGTLFCPEGKVRMKPNSAWTGAIAAGKSVDLGDNVVLTHEPFLGLAF